MHLTITDRVLAGLACAYFAWRVVAAVRTGVYAGDGDLDVHAERNPGAFALTVVSGILVAALLAFLLVMPAGKSHRASTPASVAGGAARRQ